MQKEINPIFIIAEAGVNHNGKLHLALKLCDAAKDAGVDAVKFQTFKTEKVLKRGVEMADYQKKNLDSAISQFDMAKQLELSYNDFVTIKEHCDNIGIQFLSTPDEEASLDFLYNLGQTLIKVGSGEINNIPFLRKIGNKHCNVILSTGMSCLGDVEKAYNTLIISGAKSVALLHCTTNYPCPMEEVNLKAMLTLKDALKAKVGYSDHTLGIEMPIAAVALGAQIIEKHFTLDNTMVGPDHKASLEPQELKKMVEAIRNIEKALGDGIKKPNESEIKIQQLIKKSIVANTTIKVGEMFTESNLTVKRAGDGISPELWDMIIGRIAIRNFKEEDLIII